MNSNTFTIAFCRVDSFNPHAEISGIQKFKQAESFHSNIGLKVSKEIKTKKKKAN